MAQMQRCCTHLWTPPDFFCGRIYRLNMYIKKKKNFAVLSHRIKKTKNKILSNTDVTLDSWGKHIRHCKHTLHRADLILLFLLPMSINEDNNPIANKYSNYVRSQLRSAGDDWAVWAG